MGKKPTIKMVYYTYKIVYSTKICGRIVFLSISIYSGTMDKVVLFKK